MLPSTSRTLRLWSSRTCDTVSAAASTRSRSAPVAIPRLDVHDDVDPRQSLVQRILHAIGGRVPLPDRGARGDADDDVREALAARPPEAQPPELYGRLECRDRSAREPRVVLG